MLEREGALSFPKSKCRIGSVPKDWKTAARAKLMLDSGCCRSPKRSFEKYGGSAHEKWLNFSYLLNPY